MMRQFIPFAALGLLAACGEEVAPVPSDASASAEGDVLEGSISDAMLPLDTITSTSPPLQAAPSSGENGSSGSSASEVEASEAAAEEAPSDGVEESAANEE